MSTLPPHPPLPGDPVQRQFAILIRDAYDRTLLRLLEAVRAERASARYYQAVLLDLQRIWLQTDAAVRAWALGTAQDPGALAAAFRQGAELAGRELARQGGDRLAIEAALATINRDAARIVAGNLILDVGEVLAAMAGQADTIARVAAALSGHQLPGPVLALAAVPPGPRVPPLIGRQVQDVFRRVGLEATARKVTEGLTVRQTRQVILADLAERGIQSFTDQAGRRWSLPAYSEMVSRTTTREANQAGMDALMDRFDHDLVRMTEHQPTCEICAVRQGRVYSRGGRTPGYPILDFRIPLHGNCRHSLLPYNPQFDPDAEAVRAFSNRPFDEDPRTAEERRRYELSQEIKAVQREKRRIAFQLAEGEAPLDAHMQRWADELAEPGLAPDRRRELQEQLASRADAWEAGRRERLKNLNRRLIELNREARALAR